VVICVARSAIFMRIGGAPGTSKIWASRPLAGADSAADSIAGH